MTAAFEVQRCTACTEMIPVCHVRGLDWARALVSRRNELADALFRAEADQTVNRRQMDRRAPLSHRVRRKTAA